VGRVTLSGEWQTLFEATEIGEYQGYIFLDKLEAGDTVEMRIMVKDEEDDTYKRYMLRSWSGVQEDPVKRVEPLPCATGLKVEMRQTAGTYKEVTFKFFGRA